MALQIFVKTLSQFTFYSLKPLKYVARHNEVDLITIWNETKTERTGKTIEPKRGNFNTKLQTHFSIKSLVQHSQKNSVSKLYSAQTITTWNLIMVAQRCDQIKKVSGS